MGITRLLLRVFGDPNRPSENVSATSIVPRNMSTRFHRIARISPILLSGPRVSARSILLTDPSGCRTDTAVLRNVQTVIAVESEQRTCRLHRSVFRRICRERKAIPIQFQRPASPGRVFRREALRLDIHVHPCRSPHAPARYTTVLLRR
jgi:hypothetical protein